MHDLESSSSRRGTSKPLTPYVLRMIAVSPQVRLIRSCQVGRHATMEAGRMNRCQGTPSSEELHGKELHGAPGGDLEPREPAVS